MPTRLYLATSNFAGGVPPISPAFDAVWGNTTGAARRWLIPSDVRDATDLLGDTADFAETSGVTIDVLMVQFISPGLLAPVTIGGTLKGQIRVRESHADADMRAQVIAKVVSNDGAIVRGTLLGPDTGGLGSEFATSLTNRRFPRGGAQSLSSVSALAGDRIVIEVGYRAHDALTSSRSARLRVGQSAAADLPEDETTTTDLNPWFEFSDTLTFAGGDRRVSHAIGEAVARDPAPARRVSQLFLEVVAREYWYGWGVVLDSTDD